MMRPDTRWVLGRSRLLPGGQGPAARRQSVNVRVLGVNAVGSQMRGLQCCPTLCHVTRFGVAEHGVADPRPAEEQLRECP